MWSPPTLPESTGHLLNLPVGGRLRFHWALWDQLFNDPWVVDTLKYGYQLTLIESPPLTTAPRERLYSLAHQATLADAVAKLVDKRAVRELVLPERTPGFYSEIFLVPKKDSPELRMIHNLKSFNKNFLEKPPTFRMVSLSALIHLLRQGDFLASIDLKDAYLHVPIHPDYHKYLRFVFQERHYQWEVLPFGISVAPWLFTRITTPIVGYLHSVGVRLEAYLDDLILANQLEPALSRQLRFTTDLFQRLGWILNLTKSELVPTQNLQFIGGRFHTGQGRLFVPRDRWDKIQPLLRQLLSHPRQNLLFWQTLLGLLTSAQFCTERGRLHLRPLQRFLYPFLLRNEPQEIVCLPDRLRPALEWWTTPCNVLSGVSMSPFVATEHLYTDASMVGWGAHLGGEVVSGQWSVGEQGLHINCLEFWAVILAIRHWRGRLAGSNLMVATDNATVASYINKQGGTHSQALLDLTFQFFTLVDSIPLDVRARHIPGATNVLADALSRPDQPSPTEWKLLPVVFRWLMQTVAHPPLVDLFATRFNNQLPLFVSPIPDPQAMSYDALALDWEGMDAYAFPPIALIPRVLERARLFHCRILLIAPKWPNRAWYPDLVDLAESTPIPLPVRRDLLVNPHTRQFHTDIERLALHAWPLLSTP